MSRNLLARALENIISSSSVFFQLTSFSLHQKSRRHSTLIDWLSFQGEQVWLVCLNLTAWCKSVTRTPGPVTTGPPRSLKMGLGTPPKFKTGTSSKFKSGTPSSFFNEFIFLRIFHRFFTYLFLCLFWIRYIQKNINWTEIHSQH